MKKDKIKMGSAGLILSVSSVLLGSAAAWAQDADAQQAMAIADEIIVTAQRRSESLARVPLAISAVGENLLQSGSIDNALALQAVVPGLVVNNIGSSSSIFLRGVGSRAALAGLEPSIATYQDDRYIAGAQGNLFELMDVERVEVVKGPQGVLFGRNATAGAIRVITKEVESDFGGYVQASYGNYDAYQVRGAINLPLGENAGLRVSAMTHQHDGYEKNLVTTGRSRMNDRSVSAIRAKLKLEPSDTVTLRLTLDGSRQDDSSGLATVILPPYDLSTLTANGATTGVRQGEFASSITTKQRQRTFGTQFRADIDLGFADFASITTYGDNKAAYPMDYDGTNVVALDINKLRARNETFTQEVQLVSQGGGALDWLAGAIYYDNKAYLETVLDTSAGRLTPTSQQTAWTKSYAGFGQLTWHLNDQIALIAGGRYTHDRVRVFVEQSPGAINTIPAASLPFKDAATFEKFTPKAAIQWNIDSERMLYASYSRGFKSGGFAAPPTPPAVVVQPEILDNYEIGFKGSFGRMLSFALSGFYYDYKDLQVSATITNNNVITQLTTNAANATIKGVELEATLRPLSNFSITTALSYLDGEYDDYGSAVGAFYNADTATPGSGLGMATGVPINASGMDVLRMPKFSGFVSGNYQIPVGSGMIETSATYSFKSKYDYEFVLTENTRNLRQPGFGILSGEIGYAADGGRWKISVYGVNILDKTYFNLRQSGSTGVIAVYGEPRTYGIRLEAKF